MPISSNDISQNNISHQVMNGVSANIDIGNEKLHNVGILALEVYFPRLCVDQVDLEKFDNVSSGKYTIGLGQEKMAYGADCEDVYSFCLTVVKNLIEKTGINISNIGRLEVGTETILDKSKSIKSVLMQLFEESGNFDMEGVDNINACYGGTAAFLNSINWIESDSWDGRLALVVASDIAVYAAGPARPTGGAGAIAMLLGPNAPLVLEKNTKSSYSKHVYDFYKPNLTSEYPEVDGKLSIQCYLESLDHCYTSYMTKLQRLAQSTCKSKNAQNQSVNHPTRAGANLLDYVCFHSPYCKLVEKSYARLSYLDYVNQATPFDVINGADPQGCQDLLLKHRHTKPSETYFDRDLEKDFMKFSRPGFEAKVLPTLTLAKQIGNMYTPSLYGCLLSLLLNASQSPGGLASLIGKRIGMFSYGSGSIATFYSLLVPGNSEGSLNNLMPGVSDIASRLDVTVNRKIVQPALFAKTLKQREENHLKAPYKPAVNDEDLYPGTYYLVSMDEKYRRIYERKANDLAL